MSLRRTDLLSLSNLRNDGRKPGEIRRVEIQMGPLSDASVAGSCLFHMGLTTALATVRGPIECSRRSDEIVDRACLEVNLRIAPFATADRRVVNPKSDKRLLESSNLIKKAMEAAVLLNLYPRAKIDIDILIIADDGSRLCCAINAATLALVDAGIGMKDLVCSCSAGLSGENGDTEIVDINRIEMGSHAGESAVFLPCATMPQRGTVVLAQCESRLPLSIFEKVLAAAVEGCEAIFYVMQESVRERANELLAARQGKASIELHA